MANPIFRDPLFTPLMASDEELSKMPPVFIQTTTADPLLDDSVSLCRRMRKVGAKCHLEMLGGLPHGFLNLAIVSTACRNACFQVSGMLERLVKNDVEQ